MSHSLQYSTNALNVKSLFFNKKISVYVEGKEDILFWEKIFSSIGGENIHIEETNGVKVLTEHMDKIIDENANIIVACDNDHSPFMENIKYISPKIVRTYGYSIENSMYCINNINNITRRFAKTRKDFKDEIKTWYNTFCDTSSILLYYDIANHKFIKSTKIFGDKCNRFLKSKNSSILCNKQVDKFINSVKNNFAENEIMQCVNLVKADNRELRFLIKGHFLTNGIINLIKHLVKEETGSDITLNLDSLYSLSINCIVACNNRCCDISTIQNRAVISLKSIELN